MRHIAIILAVALTGCASQREASVPQRPHTAPAYGSKYSRIIIIQKTDDTVHIPRSGPVAPNSDLVQPPTIHDSDVSSEDCPDGRCNIPNGK